ncbi:MAG: bifunctional diaminohydroxyphosphoribosylaminopyrimidine deaminase/5-amino-6-(5-phosphoribosylamino)uracil reductase RibD, partial [Dehalococcoidia bacterium]
MSDPDMFMARALELAGEQAGRTSPNPTVGAVVVRDGRIVGEGAYRGPGSPHGEAAALADAGEDALGATLYVTLEPCSHRGDTPPCVEAILAAGAAEVHLSHLDPDTRVAGQGKARLEAAGIRVVVGEGEAEARRLNEAYLKHRTTGLPFVVAKFAASLDGKIAATSGDSRWVSGPDTRAWSLELRTRIDAIAVGVNTVLVDDPQLTARIEDTDDHSTGPGQARLAERQPLRVIIDSRGRTPPNAQALGCGAKTLIATTDASAAGWRAEIESTGARVVVLPADDPGRVALSALLSLLGTSNVLTLLIEGGG